jgi:GNAT superfamily N-acetyltransferase
VTRLEILPFADVHLDEAARLLAARHARHRAAEPLLSARYEKPAAAREELAQAWAAEQASGAAAFRNGRMVGYLVGAPRPAPHWGANTWVEAPGHAVEEAEAIRDLYAVAAARWVDEGRPRHFALAPAHDPESIDAWSRLCFGRQHAHGIQEVPARQGVALPNGLEIREPRPDEIEQLVDLDLVLPDHQQLAPVFSGLAGPTREESRQEWEEAFAGPEGLKILIGALNGRPVACWALVDAKLSGENRGLIRPDHACHIGSAATTPKSRGSGVGVALTEAAFAWAADEGYPVIIADWRMTNLLASRFWPKRGFRTSFLRLYRSIP